MAAYGHWALKRTICFGTASSTQLPKSPNSLKTGVSFGGPRPWLDALKKKLSNKDRKRLEDQGKDKAMVTRKRDASGREKVSGA